MKKLLIAIVALAMVGVALKSSAITVTVNQVAGYFATDGEFNVSPVTGVGYGAADLYNNNSGALGFGTFCIDRGAGIVIPGTYNATIIPSGIDPVDGAPLTIGAAWLFFGFASDTGPVASIYNYTPGVGRVGSAYQMQLAIWVLQNQYPLSSIVPGSNPFINAVTAEFGTLLGAEAANNQFYNVGVLGLNNISTGAEVQPMLTLLPDGGSALMLLGMALSGLALISRKMRARVV